MGFGVAKIRPVECRAEGINLVAKKVGAQSGHWVSVTLV